MRRIIIYIFLLMTCVSCLMEEQKPVDIPVAKVNDKYLYKKDLQRLFKQRVFSQDSVMIVKNYIDNWIKEQLMLAKAELNLNEEEKDVQEKLMNYRNSLIIYKYQEHFIKRNLDTLITDEEVKEYYEENTQNFILDNNLVKGLYIKISDDLPNKDISDMVGWLKSKKEEDKQHLYNFCIQFAENFDDFNKDWVAFNMLQLQFPIKISNPESTLAWNKFFEAKDSSFYYYLRIDDFVPKSKVAPLDYIEDKIRSIILNKRKITLIKQLEKDLYNDALNRDMVKIYE